MTNRQTPLIEPASRRKIGLTALALYLFSQVLFLLFIQFPKGQNFDEFHYVPSAKQFLAWSKNQNWEHPPLGKMLIAVGIATFGDRPLGWRVMSTLFGALTISGVYLWGLALFRKERTALWIALLTLVNQLVYVQARIGMLDTFMMAFLVAALAAFTALWDAELPVPRARNLLRLAGVFFGFATACKWFAVVAWWSCLGLVGVVMLLQYWQMRFENERATDWYRPELWKGLTARDWLVGLVVLPLGTYLLCCVPQMLTNPGEGIWELIAMQARMYDGQLRVTTAHPYASGWADWPLLRRPIWYAFDREGSFVRGVILLGNPWVMWTGIAALGVCLWGFVRDRSREAFLVLAFYAALFGSWVVIPRKIAFYYYYYPAGVTLGLALAYAFSRWEAFAQSLPNSILRQRAPLARWAFLAIAAGVFVYFFPVLSGLKIPGESYRRWMWLSSWI